MIQKALDTYICIHDTENLGYNQDVYAPMGDVNMHVHTTVTHTHTHAHSHTHQICTDGTKEYTKEKPQQI